MCEDFLLSLSFDSPFDAHTVALSGWELVTVQPSCTVYKKLYEDTGLFKYKVIGTYQDITAKDFYDVQVGQEGGRPTCTGGTNDCRITCNDIQIKITQ